jgi:hypothetical protein
MAQWRHFTYYKSQFERSMTMAIPSTAYDVQGKTNSGDKNNGTTGYLSDVARPPTQGLKGPLMAGFLPSSMHSSNYEILILE